MRGIAQNGMNPCQNRAGKLAVAVLAKAAGIPRRQMPDLLTGAMGLEHFTIKSSPLYLKSNEQGSLILGIRYISKIPLCRVGE